MLWLKAVHIMAVISWMAGLLYIYRLFVYHAMETEDVVRQRFAVMERRLLNAITTPAAIVTAGTGFGLVYYVPGFLFMPWMWLKLALVTGLAASNVAAVVYRHRLLATPTAYNHKVFRFLNEVPTLLMIGIVILVVVKPLLGG